MKIYFFDTETTGNTTKDYLCQLAIKERGVDEPLLNSTYKPPVSIPIECTMIHHISNKMVAERPAFKDSPEYSMIKELFESPDTIFVAHNAAFDAQILRNDGIEPSNLICTFKIIRTLDGDGKFAMHKLQYLRYALEMELNVPAHDALADVLVLEQLFAYESIEAMAKWNVDEDAMLKEMMEITTQPLTIRQFDFGKYKGKTIAEVAATDPGYLSWLLDQKRNSEADEKDWIYTLQKHLGQKA
jgi:DNA polymerase III alpha subunit (gram-positive type)